MDIFRPLRSEVERLFGSKSKSSALNSFFHLHALALFYWLSPRLFTQWQDSKHYMSLQGFSFTETNSGCWLCGNASWSTQPYTYLEEKRRVSIPIGVEPWCKPWCVLELHGGSVSETITLWSISYRYWILIHLLQPSYCRSSSGTLS